MTGIPPRPLDHALAAATRQAADDGRTEVALDDVLAVIHKPPQQSANTRDIPPPLAPSAELQRVLSLARSLVATREGTPLVEITTDDFLVAVAETRDWAPQAWADELPPLVGLGVVLGVLSAELPPLTHAWLGDLIEELPGMVWNMAPRPRTATTLIQSCREIGPLIVKASEQITATGAAREIQLRCILRSRLDGNQ